ncbi:hypothetical protein NKR23_g5850 [Pleurostoma richardsiae]|uniref:Heterokaryon incompatibility domain-containing protein n=1 Tax=Pleurostoma richardsiae TaxID=41990 RepID=A0AA38VQ59_9PEZI|nr:hypothetical protein NKR23_g5850 [Pleurostoma richardsiae]
MARYTGAFWRGNLLALGGIEAYDRYSSWSGLRTGKERPYQRTKLHGGRSKEIRLISLQPGWPWQRIHLKMSVASLDAADLPEYTALSYTWGEPIQRSAPLTSIRGCWQHIRGLWWHYCLASHEAVLIDDHPFAVSRNLATVLHHLRSRETASCYWIDAICINQMDDVEKAQQVALMPDIYSKAHKTCIWLGKRADSSAKAMDFVDRAHQMNLDDPNALPDREIPTQALLALFNRSWWYRVWVVQEAILSRDALVACGSRVVPLWKFQLLYQKEMELRQAQRSAARVGNLKSRDFRAWTFIPPTLPFYHILALNCMGFFDEVSRSPSFEQAGHHLGKLVEAASKFQSTLPRDKIYGLLGLVPGAQKHIQVHYGPEKTDGDVFRDATVFLIRSMNSLKPLLYEKSDEERVDGPSWAINPSWPQRGQSLAMSLARSLTYHADDGFLTWLRLAPFDILNINSRASVSDTTTHMTIWAGMRLFAQHCASLYHQRYGVDPVFSEDLETMSVRGLIFDTVTAASPAGETYNEDVYHVTDPRHGGTVAVSWGTLQAYTLSWKLIQKWRTFLNANLATADPYREAKGGRDTAFWRKVVADKIRGPDARFMPIEDEVIDKAQLFFSYYRGPCTWEFWFGDAEARPLSQNYRIFMAECFRAVTCRSLILTERGFMGLAPLTVRAGDVVCVIRGCDVPLVLRPVPGEDGALSHYRFVGECYVHGIMYGDFARAASSRDVVRLDVK